MTTQLTSKNAKWSEAMRTLLMLTGFTVVLVIQLLIISRELFTVDFVSTVSSAQLITGSFIIFAIIVMNTTYHRDWPDEMTDKTNVRFVIAFMLIGSIGAQIPALLSSGEYQTTTQFAGLSIGYILIILLTFRNAYESINKLRTAMNEYEKAAEKNT